MSQPNQEILDYYGFKTEDAFWKCTPEDQAWMLTTPIRKNGDVCCTEHGTVYGDEDLVNVVSEFHEMTPDEFRSEPLGLQHMMQRCWVDAPEIDDVFPED